MTNHRDVIPPPNKFVIGVRVKIRGGFTEMLVTDIKPDGDMITVEWRDELKKHHELTMSKSCFVRVQ
jgi:hypothetical protein